MHSVDCAAPAAFHTWQSEMPGVHRVDGVAHCVRQAWRPDSIVCSDCPALRWLDVSKLGGLYGLFCENCPALAVLTALPGDLNYLHCSPCTALPDVRYPAWLSLRHLDRDDSGVEWRRSVHRRHTADRRRVGALLPAAALYV